MEFINAYLDIEYAALPHGHSTGCAAGRHQTSRGQDRGEVRGHGDEVGIGVVTSDKHRELHRGHGGSGGEQKCV